MVSISTLFIALISVGLVTLLSSDPEVQYVALRNINLIVQKRLENLINQFHFLLETK